MRTSIRGLLAATLLAGTALAATPALADDTDPPSAITVNASATVVSQYRFRGISQSNNKPAFQGSITVSHSSGFYISTWGSTTAGDFEDTPIAPGGTEIDVYGGYAHTFGAVKVDVGVYGYLYPTAQSWLPSPNFFEIYGSLSGTIGPVTAKAGINVAPGQTYFKDWGVTNHNVYVFGDLSGGIPGTPVSLFAHVGYTDGGLRYGKNYVDWSVGASVTWNHLTLAASVVGTDISRSDANFFAGCGGYGPCVDYFHRPAKTVGLVSGTASF